jgi:hypothetical protein
METVIEALRYTTSFFALATAIAMTRALATAARTPTPMTGVVRVWLAVVTIAGTLFSHVTGTLPASGLVPVGVALGLGLGIAACFSPGVAARFAALDDRQWRMLTLPRAVFGALLLAAGTVGLMPTAFTLPAGIGDILTAGLAFVVPGSIAVNGHRGYRLLVFGVGLLDFAGVLVGIVGVVVPSLAVTRGVGLSLLLPWVAVPMLATLNLFGFRLVLRELFRVPATSS